MIKCKHCGFQIEQPSKFCEKCGSWLTQQFGNCGTKLSVRAKLCSECGAEKIVVTILVFRDNNLETAVSKMLGKTEGQLTMEDLEGLPGPTATDASFWGRYEILA